MRTVNPASYKLIERPIYGSSRVGIDNTPLELIGYTAPTSGILTHELGLKQYEFSNHLGNVLTTVTDKKIPVDIDNNGTIDYYVADITSATDYYPFGSPMDGRTFSGDKYRFGFNGKELDNEIQGDGNAYDFGARIYDSRLGRWLSLDPLMAMYPMYTPYNAFGCNPIVIVDNDGREIKLYTYTYTEEYFNTQDERNFNTKRTDGLTNSLSIQAMQDYMDTPEGLNYVAQYAKAGDVIMVGNKQYKFDKDGAFKDQVLEINDYVNMEEGSAAAVASTSLSYSYVLWNGMETKEYSFPTSEDNIKDVKYKGKTVRETKIHVGINLYFSACSKLGRLQNAITFAHEAFIHDASDYLNAFLKNKKKSTDQLNNFNSGDGGNSEHKQYLLNNNSFPKFMKFIKELGGKFGANNVSKAKSNHDRDINKQ